MRSIGIHLGDASRASFDQLDSSSFHLLSRMIHHTALCRWRTTNSIRWRCRAG